MINTIKKLIRFYPPTPEIYLGRWAIKNTVEECNKYMLHLHADPGYIDPHKKHPEKYIDITNNDTNSIISK